MKDKEKLHCGECILFLHEDIDGFGICSFDTSRTKCSYVCDSPILAGLIHKNTALKQQLDTAVQALDKIKHLQYQRCEENDGICGGIKECCVRIPNHCSYYIAKTALDKVEDGL